MARHCRLNIPLAVGLTDSRQVLNATKNMSKEVVINENDLMSSMRKQSTSDMAHYYKHLRDGG